MYFMVCALGNPEELQYLPILKELNVGMELQGYGPDGITSQAAWDRRLSLHKATVKEIRRSRPAGSQAATTRLAVHGPFIGLAYNHNDCLLKTAIRKRLDMTFKMVRELKPDMLVLHTQYRSSFPRFEMQKMWAENIVNFWRREIKRYAACGVRVVLENLEEPDPELMIDIVDRVDHEYLGLCLDTGHANIFSCLKLSQWVEQMGQRLMHIHIHDNNGDVDSHLPVGAGNIDFGDLFNAVRRVVPQATVSLEVQEKTEVIITNLRRVLQFR